MRWNGPGRRWASARVPCTELPALRKVRKQRRRAHFVPRCSHFSNAWDLKCFQTRARPANVSQSVAKDKVSLFCSPLTRPSQREAKGIHAERPETHTLSAFSSTADLQMLTFIFFSNLSILGRGRRAERGEHGSVVPLIDASPFPLVWALTCGRTLDLGSGSMLQPPEHPAKAPMLGVISKYLIQLWSSFKSFTRSVMLVVRVGLGLCVWLVSSAVQEGGERSEGGEPGRDRRREQREAADFRHRGKGSFLALTFVAVLLTSSFTERPGEKDNSARRAVGHVWEEKLPSRLSRKRRGCGSARP